MTTSLITQYSLDRLFSSAVHPFKVFLGLNLSNISKPAAVTARVYLHVSLTSFMTLVLSLVMRGSHAACTQEVCHSPEITEKHRVTTVFSTEQFFISPLVLWR